MNYLALEAIRQALLKSAIVINYIEGDFVKSVSKDLDFEYNNTKFFITITIVNNGIAKILEYQRYSEKYGIKYEKCNNFRSILDVESPELNSVIQLMYQICEFTKEEKALIELLKENIENDTKKKKPE